MINSTRALVSPYVRIAVTLVSIAYCELGHSLVSDSAALPDRVEFNRDIHPILSDRCFACHGPDKNKREAETRLDTLEGLRGNVEKTGPVVPGNPNASEMIRRIESSDNDTRMPPREHGKEVSEYERALLRRWIEQGANWEGHWAFQPIRKASTTHTIDSQILLALRQPGLEPSPKADPRTLVRRLSFDLTGLPPKPDAVERFSIDPSDEAYEKLVDEFIGSPQYGERMAVWWLDLVRYADSVGYHGDQPVPVTPFRDYVIDAFNSNKPFDRFTIEQLAGDLFPEPTTEQLIASGYNRLGMMSAEGGAQPKEYLSKYISERVRNVSGAWLGVTFGCCECHDHKFDPFPTKEFYQLEAFFADIQEKGLYDAGSKTDPWGPEMTVPSSEQKQRMDALSLKLADLKKFLETPSDALAISQALWEKEYVVGTTPKPLTGVILEIESIFQVASSDRTDLQREQLTKHYRTIAPELQVERVQLEQLTKELDLLDKNIPRTLVTKRVEPRQIRVLSRGNWMDESGEVVEPGIPAVLGKGSLVVGRLTRMDLAMWIVSPENPLTSRVAVNRLWKLFFGFGLSRKLDDLGAQGDWPTHPELLDMLAIDLMDSGWDLKRTVKQMVMSETYKQSSMPNASVSDKDPYNKWLSHQGRWRLDAEFVRDSALAISGLIVPSVGNNNGRQFQPKGYWDYLNFPKREWQIGVGEQLYRRGLYTHWQRQYLHPSLLAFDAPGREECTAERARSNTPLQALVLLNDPTYVEAARGLSQRILTSGRSTDPERIEWAIRESLCRKVTNSESQLLLSLLNKNRADYATDTASADKLLSVGEYSVNIDLNRTELAAWTNVARAILNLHETITRN